MNNFYTALYQANLLYGVDLKEDVFEDIGLIAWNFIGNKNTRLYHAVLPVIDGVVTLPCNAGNGLTDPIIELVTYPFEDWQYTSNIYDYGDVNSMYVEHYIESTKLMQDSLYMPGKTAKFKQIGNKLYMENLGPKFVHVLYHGILVDEEGLPELNNKEVNAIAAYCALYTFKKEFYMTNNQASLTKAQLAEQDWQKLCDAARVPEHIDQNTMDKVLDAKTNWNRKIFGKTYKVVQ